MVESAFEKVKKYLNSIDTFAPILEVPLTDENVKIIDLSKSSELSHIKLADHENFSNLINTDIRNAGAKVGAGGYLEERAIYNQSENFNDHERRTIHLGVDLWVAAGTVVYVPLEGTIQSFKNNKGFGNFGPTIILEHTTGQINFFTLYGHLSEASLQFKEGDFLKKGELLGRVGHPEENGNWPPHIHFQIITDLESFHGDFPGVAAPSTLDNYKKICPDPNLILRLDKLTPDH
jgi:murein DD-endopeptidase MepM/ murein hydrolase activator NlpD